MASRGGSGGRWERGQVVPLLAFGIIAILIVVALAVDVGYWRYQQRVEQSAADGAAIAGATALYYASSTPVPAPPGVIAAAQDSVIENMGPAPTPSADPNVTVAVYSPPVIGTHIGNPAAVEVRVDKVQPLFFAGVFGRTSQSVSARAVALAVPLVDPACLYQLSTSAGIQQQASGTGGLILNGCALDANGPVAIGGSDTSFSALNYYGTTVPTTTVRASTYHNVAAPTTDPCAAIMGCAYLARQAATLPFPPSGIFSTRDAPVLDARGGSLIVSDGITMPTMLGPGIYYVRNGISAPVSGVDVTVVNVDGGLAYAGGNGRGTGNGNGNNGNGNNGNGKGNGGGGTTSAIVTAPTTGPTKGVAYFQPALAASSAIDITFGNPVASTWNGLFYAPTAQIAANGTGDTFSELVAGNVTIGGGKSLQVDATLATMLALKAAQTPTHVVLAE